MASILLVYPPTADPTGPYLSIPYLAAAARARGHRVSVIDANLDGWRRLLTKEVLDGFSHELRRRRDRLPTDRLGFVEAAEYLAASLALADCDHVADSVEAAVRDLRDREKFFDRSRYEEIHRLLERALALISARFYPLELSFTNYRTPCYLNDADEIRRDGGPTANPFYAGYLADLLPQIERARPDVVGISATFNAQLLQAFTIGRLVKERMPNVHVTLGGTAATQLVLRVDREVLPELAPFIDSIALFEGERTLSDLADRVGAGSKPIDLVNVVEVAREPFTFEKRGTAEPLDEFPTPDYSDLPLDRYLAPELLLYLAPTRGCYWEKCAFCHYGLTDSGTAPYRRRKIDRFVEDLALLQSRHGARYFYFAGDLIDPRYMFDLAERVLARGLDIRFTSDLRIERSFTAERCRRMKQAGLLAAAFGTESDSPRLLDLIEKGTDPAANRQVFTNFAEAGVAVQAMTFIDFPTETAAEANATLDLLEKNQDKIDLFFVEEFDLESGSRVFREPARFDVAEVWYAHGDRFRVRARFRMNRDYKRAEDYSSLFVRMDRIASAYGRRPYPYAGSVSVCHTQLWFDRFGRAAFKQAANAVPATSRARRNGKQDLREARPRLADGLVLGDLPFDLEALARHVGEHSTDIEERRLDELRDVTRATFEALCAEVPPFRARESCYVFRPFGMPLKIPGWVWMLLSCLDGETTLAEAAHAVKLDSRVAADAIESLLDEKLVTLEPATGPGGTCVTGA